MKGLVSHILENPDSLTSGDVITIRNNLPDGHKDVFPPEVLTKIMMDLLSVYTAISSAGGEVTIELYEQFGPTVLLLLSNQISDDARGDARVVQDLVNLDFMPQTPFNLTAIELILNKMEIFSQRDRREE